MESELKPIRQEFLKHHFKLNWVGLPALGLSSDIELVRLHPGRCAVDLPRMNAIGEDDQVVYSRADGAHLRTPYRVQSPLVRVTGFDTGYFEHRIGVRSHHFRRRWLWDFPRGVVFYMVQGQRKRHVSQGPLPC